MLMQEDWHDCEYSVQWLHRLWTLMQNILCRSSHPKSISLGGSLGHFGRLFIRQDISKLGHTIQLGHKGKPSELPTGQRSFTVVDGNGIHSTKLAFCGCHENKFRQLISQESIYCCCPEPWKDQPCMLQLRHLGLLKPSGLFFMKLALKNQPKARLTTW